jgi:hypothetical protein
MAMRMPKQSTKSLGRVRLRLADDVYISWSAAQLECQAALVAWFTAATGDRAAANWAYRAALDREEAAARDLEWLSKLLFGL